MFRKKYLAILAVIFFFVVKQVLYTSKLHSYIISSSSSHADEEILHEDIKYNKIDWEKESKNKEKVQSNKLIRSKKKKLQVLYRNEIKNLTLNNVHLLGNISYKVFEPWNKAFPCYAGKFIAWQQMFPSEISKRQFNKKVGGKKLNGLIYIKVPKTGSSTLSGINLRIAHKHTSSPSNDPCNAIYRHFSAKHLKTEQRNRNKSFLWTFVRDPNRQFLSEFFHFKITREEWNNTIENFDNYVNKSFIFSKRGSVIRHPQLYWIYHRNVSGNTMSERIQNVLNQYDFIGLTERLDESLVVLRLLLGLNAEDILYVSSKVSGGYDDGSYSKKCYKIVPSVVTPQLERYFNSNKWKRINEEANKFYEAVSISLDLTIEALGKKRFEKALSEHLFLMNLAESICAPRAIFPCSSNGKRQVNKSKQNCYMHDSGCGYPCLDELYKNTSRTKQLGHG